ncbi:hypothetical protein [Allosalinactinospora lopnorensis]|uniref:hypothetical protein n=1 Tax=Allosalinactinospora lopnorensis TaxID=1352348 RepID=UPI00138F42EB|nr:hypothetical protein [Allosalinactinospora lopnorensis]
MLALDLETGGQRWCAPGVTGVQADPEFPDRIAGYADGSWLLLDTASGERVATIDVDRTRLANVQTEDLQDGRGSVHGALGGGRLALWRGTALAVYGADDGSLLHQEKLPRPPKPEEEVEREERKKKESAEAAANGGTGHGGNGSHGYESACSTYECGGGHAITDVVIDEAATVTAVAPLRRPDGSKEPRWSTLTGYGPDGGVLWRRGPTAPDGVPDTGAGGGRRLRGGRSTTRGRSLRRPQRWH